MITHDLGVIAEIADDVLVMYAGRAVENGPTQEDPHAPGDALHLGAAEQRARRHRRHRRAADPDPRHPAEPAQPARRAAPFHPRCPHIDKVPGDLCRTTLPELAAGQRQPGHLKRCHLVNPDEIYLKEVLPEIAPDLIDPETGEAIARAAGRRSTEIQGETAMTRPMSIERTDGVASRPDARRPCSRSANLREVLPGQVRRRHPPDRRPRAGRRRRLVHGPARRLARAWSASPAAASRRPAG